MVKKEELFEVTSMFRTLLKSISQEWNKRGREYNLSFPQYKMLYILDMSGTQKVSGSQSASESHRRRLRGLPTSCLWRVMSNASARKMTAGL